MGAGLPGFPFPVRLVSHGGRTGCPDWALCLGFPTRSPSACTCNPDCSGLEARPSLEELSVAAARAGDWER